VVTGAPLNIKDLLRDPRLVRSAILLREVLGPPLSRRRRAGR
jgi:hypothetical protein